MTVLGFITVGLMAGCGGGSRLVANPNLVGGIFFTGRVPSSLPKLGLQAGLVEIYEANRGVVAKERIGRGERFSFRLPAGVYSPQAVISLGTCIYGGSSDGKVVVRKGRVTHANLYCAWH